MIIRRATLVVAGTTMPRSATPWRPQALPEGPAKRDRAAGGDAPTARRNYAGRYHPAAGSHLPSEETAPPYAVVPDFTATAVGQGFAGSLLCQAPCEGAARSVARGTREAGSGQRRGCDDRGNELVGRASRYRVASSCGRNCSALRGRTIRFVAFRASHPATPLSRPR